MKNKTKDSKQNWLFKRLKVHDREMGEGGREKKRREKINKERGHRPIVMKL